LNVPPARVPSSVEMLRFESVWLVGMRRIKDV
jgi:hypothetical protein